MNATVAISTVADGNMLLRADKTNPDVIKNRSVFLNKNGIDINRTVMICTSYDGDNYCRYREISDVDKSIFGHDLEPSDALITKSADLALLLPIADCVGAVLFDPSKKVLMLSHLGRHSLEQNGGFKSIQFLIDNYGCSASDLLVWLTPAPGKANYPVFAFDNKSMKEIIFEQLQTAGIPLGNITDDPTDAAVDHKYYSHSEFLKGNRTDDGRYAIVAIMKD